MVSGLKASVVSAGSGAVATAFVVAPFDVVKTRSQASGSQSVMGSENIALRVLRQEGVGALWSGLRPSLLMTVPANVIYFSAYEHLRNAIANADGRRGSEDAAPVLAAAGAKNHGDELALFLRHLFLSLSRSWILSMERWRVLK